VYGISQEGLQNCFRNFAKELELCEFTEPRGFRRWSITRLRALISGDLSRLWDNHPVAALHRISAL